MKEELKSKIVSVKNDHVKFNDLVMEALKEIEGDSLLSAQYNTVSDGENGNVNFSVLLIYKVAIKKEDDQN